MKFQNKVNMGIKTKKKWQKSWGFFVTRLRSRHCNHIYIVFVGQSINALKKKTQPNGKKEVKKKQYKMYKKVQKVILKDVFFPSGWAIAKQAGTMRVLCSSS